LHKSNQKAVFGIPRPKKITTTASYQSRLLSKNTSLSEEHYPKGHPLTSKDSVFAQEKDHLED